MKNRNLFLRIGILIFIVVKMINKFIVEISDPIYIMVLLISIAFVIIGMIRTKNITTYNK
ncbi:MAG: hypothetical protein LBM16_02900 [Clostridiales bacterium]|jgi:hypothetical protein|nr:hypothetical protein [Clostridiales bacterium]